MTDLLKLVMKGMKWDKKKAQLWFNTPNPLLGGMTPNWYETHWDSINISGRKRLEEFIRTAIDENQGREKMRKISGNESYVAGFREGIKDTLNSEAVRGMKESLMQIEEYWNGASESAVSAMEDCQEIAHKALTRFREWKKENG